MGCAAGDDERAVRDKASERPCDLRGHCLARLPVNLDGRSKRSRHGNRGNSKKNILHQTCPFLLNLNHITLSRVERVDRAVFYMLRMLYAVNDLSLDLRLYVGKRHRREVDRRVARALV